MSETPNPCDLKLVILFDPREESCTVFSHNLSAEDASQAVGRTATRRSLRLCRRSTLPPPGGMPG